MRCAGYGGDTDAFRVRLHRARAERFCRDPVGSYTVEGNNRGGGSHYSGTVTVSRSGGTYRVVWVVGPSRYVGTGIGDKDFIDFIAVSYRSGNDTRPCPLRLRRRQLEGIWTYAGGREVGTEI